MNYQIVIVIIFMTFALLEARHFRFFNKKNEVKADFMVELIGTFLLFIFTTPFVIFCAAWMATMALPDYANFLSDTPILLQLALLIVFDDMTQY